MKNTFAITIILLTTTFAHAKPPEGDGNRGAKGHRGPPPEAIEACSNESAGADCSFTGGRGEESGTCFTPDENKPLACKPQGHK